LTNTDLSPLKLPKGSVQANPTSSVFYGFCNADLIEPSRDPNKLKLACVDDTMFFVAGKTFQENNMNLADMMTRQGGATEWSKTHNSNFEVDKFAFLHLSHKLKPDPNHKEAEAYLMPPSPCQPHHPPHSPQHLTNSSAYTLTKL
jgi:hypothetical protein